MTREPRVVIVQRLFHPNTLAWVRELQVRGFQVTVIVSELRVESPEGICEVVHAQPIGWLQRWSSRLLPRGRVITIPRPLLLLRAVGFPRPNLVLLKQQRQSVFAGGPHVLLASLYAALFKVRRISWGNSPDGRSAAERRLGALGLMPRRHFRTIGPVDGPQSSGGNAHNASDGHRFPASAWKHEPVVPYAAALSVGVARDRQPTYPIRVLTVGKFRSERNRPWWTLEAAAEAGLLDGRATFTFVGIGGPESEGYRRIMALARKNNVEMLVRCRADVPHAEMSAIYEQHDLLVLPAHSEPFGMVVLEAMTHGLPAIVSSSVGAKGLVADGETGAVFDDQRVPALAAALKELCSDPERLRLMGERARKRAATWAAPERSITAILALAEIEG